MLADVLLCSLATTVLATLALLGGHTSSTGSHRYVPARAARPARGRGGDVPAVLLAGAPAILLVIAGEPLRDVAWSAAICAASSGLWLARTRRWTIAAHLTWASAVTAGGCFLGYTATWTVTSQLGVAGLAGGLLLWLLECAAYLLSLAYLWQLVDAVGSRGRRAPGRAASADGPLPYVPIQLPAGARGRRFSGAVVVLGAAAAAVVTVASLSGPGGTPGPSQQAATSGDPLGGAAAGPSQPRTSASRSSAPSSTAADPARTSPVAAVTTPVGAPAASSSHAIAGSPDSSSPDSSAPAATPTRTQPDPKPSKPRKTKSPRPSHPAPTTTRAGHPTSKPTPTTTRGKP